MGYLSWGVSRARGRCEAFYRKGSLRSPGESVVLDMHTIYSNPVCYKHSRLEKNAETKEKTFLAWAGIYTHTQDLRLTLGGVNYYATETPSSHHAKAIFIF